MASQTSTHAARAGAAPRGTAFSFSALRRAVGFMLRHYAAAFAAVVACIIVAALATAQSLLFTQDLIDVYIEPMIATGSTDFSGLASYLVRLGGVLIVGVVAAFAYNRIMVTISQGTMRRLRDELFEHMESLPIRYFDTHPHGDIMSVYTNDVDTLRQLYAQTLPQLVNSCVTLVVTFAAMVALSVPLTVLSLVLVALMVFSTLAISRASAPYFAGQQRSLGEVEGLVEELMDGQKVIKVFCHEGSEQARHAPRQRAAARRYQPRHGHLQPRHARERQHRQHLLRGDGGGGRRHGHRGRGRTYAGRARELCESQP
ncbi:ABC transporter ATP-binding protein [Olsenella profusa]|uniref:ABC transporter permease n=1 Tax=Olsenella profusa TaxID=138595 RepID=UPI001EF5B0C2|nr:ABC transporter ATP-binding protein [Olsenella profusa]